MDRITTIKIPQGIDFTSHEDAVIALEMGYSALKEYKKHQSITQSTTESLVKTYITPYFSMILDKLTEKDSTEIFRNDISQIKSTLSSLEKNIVTQCSTFTISTIGSIFSEFKLNILEKLMTIESCIKLIQNTSSASALVEISSAILDTKESLAKYIKENIERVQHEVEKVDKSNTEQLSVIVNNINQILVKFSNPTVKGNIGESIVKDALGSLEEITIHDVSGEPHSCDISVYDSILDGTIFVEVKFYENAVPTSQIEKFKRDLEEKKPSLGIFMSLKSGICGYKTAQFIDGTPPMVIIPYIIEDQNAIRSLYIISRNIAMRKVVPVQESTPQNAVNTDVLQELNKILLDYASIADDFITLEKTMSINISRLREKHLEKYKEISAALSKLSMKLTYNEKENRISEYIKSLNKDKKEICDEFIKLLDEHFSLSLFTRDMKTLQIFMGNILVGDVRINNDCIVLLNSDKKDGRRLTHTLLKTPKQAKMMINEWVCAVHIG